MITLINYNAKVTLTIFSICECTNTLIDIMYIRSPNRVPENIRCQLNKSKLDLIDKFPTAHLNDLNRYSNFLFVKPWKNRLSNYYSNIKEKSAYSVCKEHFPKKIKTDFSDFLNFILECYPQNLLDEIKVYPDNFINIRYESYEDISVFYSSLNIDIDYSKIKFCENIKLSCDEILSSKINDYYKE